MKKLLPTPSVSGNHNRKGLSKKSGDGLATAIKKEVMEETAAKEKTQKRAQQSTLFAGDSLASLSVKPGSEKAKKMTVISGRKCSGLYKRSDPVGLLAKTLLGSSIWGSTTCFLTWKVRVMKHNRLLFQLVPSTPRIEETEFGYLVPTPNTCDAPAKNSNTKGPRNLMDVAKTDWKPGEMWATPQSMDWKGPQGRGYKGISYDLPSQIMFPTPTTANHKGACRKEAMVRKDGKSRMDDLMNIGHLDNPDYKPTINGQLNPTWVEWLMGFPEGWTDLNV